jgi:hypothetical protein
VLTMCGARQAGGAGSVLVLLLPCASAYLTIGNRCEPQIAGGGRSVSARASGQGGVRRGTNVPHLRW